MTNEPANDIDETAEERRDAEIERLSEVLWHVARSTNTSIWEDNKERMNLDSSEHAVGGWLRRLRETHGSEFAREVHLHAVSFGEVQIESMETHLLEAKRGQAVLERPVSELVRSLLQVAKPNA